MRRVVMILALTGLVAGMAFPAAAADLDAPKPGARVVITADVELPEPFLGTFTARGAAAARGVVCPTGTLQGEITALPAPPYDFTVRHTFTCADGSGTFAIDLSVWLFPSGRTLFVWSAAGGTGDYVGLSGSGAGFGKPIVPGDSIRDRYRGFVTG